MHLKHFTYSGSTSRKTHDHVTFPLSYLDFSWMACGQTQISGDHVFDLYAVVVHHGRVKTVLYTAFCWNQPEARSYHINDTCVKEVPAEEVKNATAYILYNAAKNMV